MFTSLAAAAASEPTPLRSLAATHHGGHRAVSDGADGTGAGGHGQAEVLQQGGSEADRQEAARL